MGMGIRHGIANWFARRSAVRKIVTAVVGNAEFQWPIHKRKNPEKLIKQFRGWVYACAMKNAQAVSQVPLRLFVITRRQDQPPRVPTRQLSLNEIEMLRHADNGSRPFIEGKIRGAIIIEEVVEHPFLSLMAKANPIMDGAELLQLVILYQELIGDSYVFKVRDALGTLAELWPLLAHKMKVIPHPTRFIDHYEYGSRPTKVKFAPEEIAHFRYPNPESYYTGLSPLQAAAVSVVLEEEMHKYELTLFGNRARPDQLLIPELPIRRDVRKRVEADFNKVLRGMTKAGKTIVLPHGFKLEQLNFSPKEMSLLLEHDLTHDDICVIFDIPPTLMSGGSRKGGGGARGQAETAEYMHAKYGIWPRCKRLEQRLNQDVVSEYDDRLFCAFDNPVPKDKEFELKRRTADLRSGMASINEIRQETGQPAVPWGHEPLMPQNVIPLSVAIANQTAKLKAQTERGTPDPKAGNQAPLDKIKPGRQKAADGADKKE